MAAPTRLYFTPDDAACALLARDPVALLIGFALDQQINVEQAFMGPLRLQQRLGHLDPARIAATDPAVLERAFREPPALHRFPATMADRVQQLCAHLAERYDGDAARVWTEAADGADLRRRLAALPGFGEMKVRTMSAVVLERLGVRLPGHDAVLPPYPTLADVGSHDERIAYQAAKRAKRAAARRAGTTWDPAAR
jgi:uncharacterized HhH-GPD family protein